MRWFDVFLFIVILEAMLAMFNGIPVYTDSTGSHPLGVNFLTDNSLIPQGDVGVANCTKLANGDIKCAAPTALSAPSLVNSAYIFGFWFSGMDFLFKYAGGGGFITALLNSIGVYAPFSYIIGVGIDVIFIYSILMMITGRYPES